MNGPTAPFIFSVHIFCTRGVRWLFDLQLGLAVCAARPLCWPSNDLWKSSNMVFLGSIFATFFLFFFFPIFFLSFPFFSFSFLFSFFVLLGVLKAYLFAFFLLFFSRFVVILDYPSHLCFFFLSFLSCFIVILDCQVPLMLLFLFFLFFFFTYTELSPPPASSFPSPFSFPFFPIFVKCPSQKCQVCCT